MADRVSVTITIGGDLPRAELDAFCAAVDAYAMSDPGEAPFDRAMITGDAPLELTGHEIAWGRLDELEDFCTAHALPFTRWCDAYPGSWEAERLVHDGTAEPRSYTVTTNDVLVMPAPKLRSLGSFSAAEAYFASAERTIPPLRIIGPETDHG